MADPITFTVSGSPVPKQSFRVGTHGGYQTARVIEWQNNVAHEAKLAMFQRAPLAGSVGVRLVFDMPTRRAVDCDNLSKGTVDGMKGIVFVDDAQVTELHVFKRQGKPGGVAVEVWETV